MRKLLLAGSCVAILTGFDAASAQAQQAREYPWCARYDWTTSNCGFVSFQQCLATIQGIGGRCEINPRYTPPRQKQQRRRQSQPY